MHLTTFLLDQWLEQKNAPETPVDVDLAASTGPRWTLHALLGLMSHEERERFFGTQLVYAAATGALELRSAIAEMSGASPADVQVLTGAEEALHISFFLAAEPGANVVVPFPCFPPMAALPESYGLETRFYRLRRENGFRVDVDEIRSLVDRNTKIVLVNSPHNPTGATIPFEEMSAIHDIAVRHGAVFLCDEVYHPIYDGEERPSAAALPHATVIGDLSKALCLSGLRVGWMLERDRERLAKVLNARQYFSITNAPLEEALATAAIQHRAEIHAQAREVAGANLAVLDRFFAEHASVLGWVRPRGGMTAFPWLLSSADARPFCREVLKARVLLAPGDCFGMPQHFRLGFGAMLPDVFRRGLDRIAERVASVAAAGKPS